MRKPVITRFAKNDRAFSGRRRIAALAATAVLAGGVQVLAMSDTAWACGDGRFDAPHAVDKPTVPSAEFRVFDSNSVAADGSWSEFGLSITNFTGADVARTAPSFSLSTAVPGTPLRTGDLRVEVMQHGAWKPLKLNRGCIGIDADTDSLAQPLANGRAADFMFRVSLSPDSPKDLTALNLATDAGNDKAKLESWDLRTVKVTHPRTAPAAVKQAPAAKPAPVKPATEKTPAAPAAEKAPAASAAEAPKSPAARPTSSPAVAAPADTAQLAHTGASGTDAFLATSAAALFALGAGVLLAVRRLRRR
ncbi:hypothetical protein ACFV1W_27380 [Kitasatospora sp. NPDC059648]|uniref:hypothetical protein n=1 Tax=Kitasatospora sp. NPDC059648 TaxID=3346894 RepID=UPI00368ACDBC